MTTRVFGTAQLDKKELGQKMSIFRREIRLGG